jgi:V-type H+-transporting ATPase subunit F
VRRRFPLSRAQSLARAAPAAASPTSLACLRARAETPRDTLERTFKAMLARDDCGLLLINQPIADAIRPVVNAHRAIIPMVLEIPSKDVAYDAKKDPLMKRVLQMLGEDV